MKTFPVVSSKAQTFSIPSPPSFLLAIPSPLAFPNLASRSLFSSKDSPQVQCLRAYKPRENDELALEKADVVMVTQQSSDGKRGTLRRPGRTLEMGH